MKDRIHITVCLKCAWCGGPTERKSRFVIVESGIQIGRNTFRKFCGKCLKKHQHLKELTKC